MKTSMARLRRCHDWNDSSDSVECRRSCSTVLVTLAASQDIDTRAHYSPGHTRPLALSCEVEISFDWPSRDLVVRCRSPAAAPHDVCRGYKKPNAHCTEGGADFRSNSPG